MPTGPRPDPPTRCAKLVFYGDNQATQWANVMWLFLTGSGEITHSDLVTLANGCSTAYDDHLLHQQHQETIHRETQVVLYSDDGVFDAVVPSGDNGTFICESLWPASAAACISWRIASHYRGGHPRTYLAGLGNEMDGGDGSSLLSSYISSLTSAALAFHSDVEGLGPIGSGITAVEHGVVSFVLNGDWRTPPVFRRINGAAVDSRIDTQRRRLGSDRAF